MSSVRTVAICALVLASGIPARAWADEPRSFEDRGDARLLWGFAAFHATFAAAAATSPLLPRDVSLAIPIETGEALAIGAATVTGAYLGEKRADVPAAYLSLVNIGLGGYMVGCGLARPAFGPGDTWDVATFDECAHEALPWVVGSLTGAASAAYVLARGDRLFRTAGHRGGDAVAWAAALAPVATSLLFFALDGSVGVGKSLASGGRPLDMENRMFPSGRGNMLMLGIIDLGAFVGAVAFAETRL